VSLGDWYARLDRTQRSRTFKIIASVIVVVVAIAGYTTYAVRQTAPMFAGEAPQAAAQPEAPAADGRAPPAQDPQLAEVQRMISESGEAMEKIAREIVSQRGSTANVGVATALSAAVALTVIWLGLGLTYLLLAAVVLGLAAPLWFAGAKAVATMLLFAVALTAAFTALLQVVRLALAPATPVLAIARNVVTEAVRIKISVVFIVMLIFAMAALPLLLDENTPLRYRVQSFLQWGTGGSFWLLALLTLFFAAGSVAFEQRDKQIWQTMTKPVAAWKYVLGKWVGVMALNAVLLAVSLSGVFMFTEYLRRQPAEGEAIRQVAAAEGPAPLGADRVILETQVLAARQTRQPNFGVSEDAPEFKAAYDTFVRNGRMNDSTFATDPAQAAKIRDDLLTQLTNVRRSVAPGQRGDWEFDGLLEAKRRNLPLTLRFKLNAGGNLPMDVYRVTVFFQDVPIAVRPVSLGVVQSLTIPYPNLIDNDGKARITFINGEVAQNLAMPGGVGVRPNAELMSVDPKEGLELSYNDGSFAGNMFRVGFVLWLKLAMLGILAICCATFLSFPVACLVAFTTFIAAEGAVFLTESLRYYDATDQITKEISYWKIPVRVIGLAVSNMFQPYGELDPTTKLVDGRLMSWGSVAAGTTYVIAMGLALFAIAVTVFRKRELATYSGQ
jgi:ABC-type transport system involved in multi-copper enzyme maturation permease subunit